MIKQKAFTLIEIVIVVTIIVTLTMMTYAPYNYYQNKVKLKVATREISQTLYESKNMATNGIIRSSSNVSIGVYFDTSMSKKNEINIFSYPYNISDSSIDRIEGGDIKIIKTLTLEKGVQLDFIDNKDNFLFFFDSITGKLRYYTWNNGIKSEINKDNINIKISYKGAISPNLQRNIKYYTFTNIIDY